VPRAWSPTFQTKVTPLAGPQASHQLNPALGGLCPAIKRRFITVCQRWWPSCGNWGTNRAPNRDALWASNKLQRRAYGLFCMELAFI